MEDEPSIRLVMNTLSQRWGRRLLEFEDGYQGMQWVEDFRAGRYDGPIPELTLSGINMPGPRGHEVCEVMRQIPELDEMAIVIMSAWRFTPEEAQLVMAACDHFIRKPLPMPSDLKVILEDVIEARRQKVSSQ